MAKKKRRVVVYLGAIMDLRTAIADALALIDTDSDIAKAMLETVLEVTVPSKLDEDCGCN